MKLLIATLILLASASSSYAQMCAAQNGNRQGDIIEMWIDYWDQGTNGFQYALKIDGIYWLDYGVTRLSETSCLHQCNYIRFTAKAANVYISNEVVSGNASGWKCSIIEQVVGHEPVQIISDRKRQQTKQYTRYLSEANAGLLFYGVPLCGAAMFVPYAFGLPCLTIGASTAFIAGVSLGLDKVDPWDENFWYPYDGDWSLLTPSIPYTGYQYVDNIIWHTAAANFWLDFIYVESNRASSCDMAGVDCVQWHIDRVNWGYQQLASSLNDVAYSQWVAAWQMEQEGFDANLVAMIRDLAGQTGAIAWEFQQ